MRERVAFVIMVAILIFLFTLTFAILGKGSYEASPNSAKSDSAPLQAASFSA